MIDDTAAPAPSSPWRRLWPWLAIAMIASAVAWGIHHVMTPGITGWVNDDGLYVDFAQSLRHGHGFSMTLTNDAMPAFRYPIMFPALLALASLGAHGTTAAIMQMQWVPPLSSGLLAFATFVYLRRIAFWPAWGALAAAILIGCSPVLVDCASLILSDASAAALGVIAAIAFEASLRRESRTGLLFAGCGLLSVVLCLIRYEAATFVVAAACVLLQQRRWKSLLAYGGAFAVGLVPWAIYRLHTGGEEYHTTLKFLTEKPPAFLFKNLSAIAATMLSKSLPVFVFPSWPPQHTVQLLLMGALVSALMFLGAIAAIRRPLPGQSGFAGYYFLISVALILVWMVRYVTTASYATERLLLPIAPFAILLFMRGLTEFRARYESLEKWPLRRLTALATLPVVLLAGYRFEQYVMNPGLAAENAARQVAYSATFDYVRDKLPADAVLVSMLAPAVYLHTGRHCHGLNYTGTDPEVIAYLSAVHADYLIGLPFILEAPPWLHQRHGYFDASVVIINDLVKQHPGLLKGVYFAGRGRLGVFKIDHSVLATAAKHLKS
ncbi:MAG TPA: hypothetical protein V6D47_09305 [Oscillatoriaceae cyanobacterium]